MISDDFVVCKWVPDPDDDEKSGRYFGTIMVDGEFWAVVKWHNKNPTCCPIERVLVKKEVWAVLEKRS